MLLLFIFLLFFIQNCFQLLFISWLLLQRNSVEGSAIQNLIYLLILFWTPLHFLFHLIPGPFLIQGLGNNSSSFGRNILLSSRTLLPTDFPAIFVKAVLLSIILIMLNAPPILQNRKTKFDVSEFCIFFICVIDLLRLPSFFFIQIVYDVINISQLRLVS